MRRLRPGASGISGRGLFAAEPIPAGALLLEMTGEELPLARMEEVCDARGLSVNMPLHSGPDRVIFLDPLPNLVNHSCEPNAGLRATRELISLRDIAAGEEITYDYSTNIEPAIDWRMAPCLCGGRGCRGVVGNIATLPPAALRWQLERGAVQDFVRRLIAAPVPG